MFKGIAVGFTNGSVDEFVFVRQRIAQAIFRVQLLILICYTTASQGRRGMQRP